MDFSFKSCFIADLWQILIWAYPRVEQLVLSFSSKAKNWKLKCNTYKKLTTSVRGIWKDLEHGTIAEGELWHFETMFCQLLDSCVPNKHLWFYFLQFCPANYLNIKSGSKKMRHIPKLAISKKIDIFYPILMKFGKSNYPKK